MFNWERIGVSEGDATTEAKRTGWKRNMDVRKYTTANEHRHQKACIGYNLQAMS